MYVCMMYIGMAYVCVANDGIKLLVIRKCIHNSNTHTPTHSHIHMIPHVCTLIIDHVYDVVSLNHGSCVLLMCMSYHIGGIFDMYCSYMKQGASFGLVIIIV